MAGAQGRGRVARGVAFAAVGGVCWGFSGTCAQLLMADYGIPVIWITCMRLLCASVLYLIVCVVRERTRLLAVLRRPRVLAGIAAFALFGVLLTQVSYLSAISYTNAGTGTVLERLGLVLLMACVCVRGRRLPRPREAAGVVLAVAGTFLIATKGSVGTLAIPAEALGWGFLLACSFVCYTMLPERLLKEWGSFVVTGLAMLIAGTLACAVVRPWTISVDASPEVMGVMAAMIIVGTFTAYLFYLQGVADAGPLRAGLVGCVEPVAATVFSAVWLATPVGFADIAGMALIIGMVFLVTQGGSDAAPREAAAAAEVPGEGAGVLAPASDEGEKPIR